ncbi:uncharacterized protein LOC128960575 [Oppia nitens]|uniref:uncharacterized protein LOC128960575 n=1 Tax=Oppia nitens TaxID=1686743 RepID=UPI0023D9A610|nr:uncharacterized protein LOC128960575 [Oppia nitens]
MAVKCTDKVLVTTVAIVYLTVVSLIPSAEACWGSTHIGVTTPDQQILNGSRLAIDCSLNNNTIEYDHQIYEVNSSMIAFKFKNEYYSSDSIRLLNTTASRLEVPAATVDDNGMYYCMLNISGPTPLICVSQVIVGFKPQPVSDFKCISWHYRKLHCQWTPPYNPIHTTYSLEDRIHASTSLTSYDHLTRPCGQIPEENSCEWRTDTMPPYRSSTLKFNLLLKGQNQFGNYSKLYVIDHYSIIKPSKPQNFVAIEVTNNRISLTWKAPEYIIYDEDLLEHILYEVQYYWQTPDNEYKSETIILDGIRLSSTQLTGLVPYITYNISIRCKTQESMSEEYWSEFSSILVTTKSDVPYLSPELIRQSFQTDKNMEGMRSITLFWKHIPVAYHNGKDFNYTIELSEHENHHKSKDNNLIEKGFDDMIISHNTSYTFNHMKSDVAYTFKIYAVNSQGVSRNYSMIIVDRNDMIAHKPLNIDAYSLGEGRYEIHWTEPRFNSLSGPVVNYTVFWCKTLRPRPFPCEGDINWKHTNSLSIDINETDIHSNYQFAVSANTATTTSGMSWAECIVPIDGRLDKLSEVHLKQINSTSISVNWKLACPAQKRVVEEYKIKLCKVDDQDMCIKSNWLPTVVDNSAESHVLTGLQPFSKYKITVVSITSEGPSEESDPKYEYTAHDSPEDAPSNLEVTEITSQSITLKWAPPKLPNGEIHYYEINCNNFKQKQLPSSCVRNNSQFICSKTLKNLKSYDKYTIQVRACNSDSLCSPSTVNLTIRTLVSTPKQMDPPRSEIFNTTSVRISWSPPNEPNGPIDYYILQLIHSDNKTYETIISGKQRHHYMVIDCESYGDESAEYRSQFAVRIRAANRRQNNSDLISETSDKTNLNVCLYTENPNIGYIIGMIVGGTLGLTLLVIVLVGLVRWMKEKIMLYKRIQIVLPKGLDVPPLMTDHSDRNSFNPIVRNDSIPNIASGVVIADVSDEDSFKNRHGSGLSHTSNSSTEGLIYKNTPNKANDLFMRLTSSDSGQHESIGSHYSGVETHISSDSGVEIDNHILNGEHLMSHTLHTNKFTKPPLPILDEISSRNSDSSGSKDSGLDVNASALKNKRRRKPKTVKGSAKISALIMPTKTDVMNPLYDTPLGHSVCIYSLLANSEPSLCDPSLREDHNILSDVTKYIKPEMAKSLTNIIQSCSPSESKVNCIHCESNNSSSRTASPACPYYKYGIKRQNYLHNNYVDLTNFSTPDKCKINSNVKKANNGYVTIDSILESAHTVKPPKKRLEHDWSQNSYDAEVSSTSSNGDNEQTDQMTNQRSFSKLNQNCVNNCEKIQNICVNNNNTTDIITHQMNANCINPLTLYPLNTTLDTIDCETPLHNNSSHEWSPMDSVRPRSAPTNIGVKNSDVFVKNSNGYVLHNAVNELTTASKQPKTNFVKKSNGYVVIESNGIEMNDLVPNNNRITQV